MDSLNSYLLYPYYHYHVYTLKASNYHVYYVHLFICSLLLNQHFMKHYIMVTAVDSWTCSLSLRVSIVMYFTHQFSFHPFGEFFASGSLDTNLKIWDIRKKGCIHTYKGHTRGVNAIRFTPDGRWVVSGGEDNTVKVRIDFLFLDVNRVRFHNMVIYHLCT